MATSINWPSDLSAPRVDFRRTIQGQTLRTPFESGYVQTRAKFTKRRMAWDCTLDLNSASEISSFETFFKDTVEAGAYSFNFVDVGFSGTGTTSYEVRFAEDSVTVQYIHVNRARVSFKLEEV